MIPQAKEALLSQLNITGPQNDRVFKTPTGKNWIKPDWLGRYCRVAIESAGIKYRNPYQMRHTFISMMLANGNGPMVPYPMVGHSNAQILFQKYAKFIKELKNYLKLANKNLSVFLSILLVKYGKLMPINDN